MKRTISLTSILPAIVVLSLLVGSPASAAERWQPIGPYGHDGYRLFPSEDPEVLYVTTFSAGLYRSENGGQSWRSVNPLFSGVLSIDPRNPDHLMGAATSQGPPVRSVNGGRTFTVVADGYLYQGVYPSAFSLLRDPGDPDIVFAATDSGLFRFDGDGPWELVAFGGFAVTAFAIDPLASDVWHAATTDPALQGPVDLQVSTDAGAHWSTAPGDVPRDEVAAIFYDPVRPNRAYALTNCRPSVFIDGSWRLLPIPGRLFSCVSTITSEGRLIASYFENQRNHLLASDDGGATWTTLGNPEDTLFRITSPEGRGEILVASGFRGMWRSTDGGATWDASSKGISGFVVGSVVVAADGTVFASPGGEGVFRSQDQGRSWRRVSQGLQADGRGTPTLAVDPRDPAVVWAGGTGLHRSRDAGRTWQGLGLPGGVVENRFIDQILVDPVREGVVYVRTFAPVAPGLLGPFNYRTLDDGRTWQPLPRFHRTGGGLAVAPSDGTLYAWSGDELFASKDAGSTWRRLQRSLPDRIDTLQVDPGRSNVLWFGGANQGVWRSTDGGRSFTLLQRGEFLSGQIGEIAFDPADPSRPYVSVHAQGIYQWRDAGWTQVGDDDPFFQGTINGGLAFDPERGILYAGTSTRGIYRLR